MKTQAEIKEELVNATAGAEGPDEYEKDRDIFLGWKEALEWVLKPSQNTLTTPPVKSPPKSRIEIDMTESDLDELREGKKFDWTYPDQNGNDIDVHLFNSDLEDQDEEEN